MRSPVAIYIILIGLTIIGVLIAVVYRSKIRKRANSIEIGMSESDLLNILGGYHTSKSVLQDGTVKYVKKWVKASSYSYKGYRTYNGVQKTTVWVKDGVVIRYDNHNI